MWKNSNCQLLFGAADCFGAPLQMGCRLFEAVALRMPADVVPPPEALAVFSAADSIIRIARRRPSEELICLLAGVACMWSAVMGTPRVELGLQLARTLSLLAKDLSQVTLAPRRPDQPSPRATVVVMAMLADAALALRMALAPSCGVLPGAVLACMSAPSLVDVASSRKDLPSAAMARAALQVCRDAAASSRPGDGPTRAATRPAGAVGAGHARNAALEAVFTALGVSRESIRAADAYRASGMSDSGASSLLASVWSCFVCLCRSEVGETTTEWLAGHGSAGASEPPPPALTALAAALAHTQGALAGVAAAPGTSLLASCAMRALMRMAEHSPAAAAAPPATASSAAAEGTEAAAAARPISASLELAGSAASAVWERDDADGWRAALRLAAEFARAGAADAKKLDRARGDAATAGASRRHSSSGAAPEEDARGGGGPGERGPERGIEGRAPGAPGAGGRGRQGSAGGGRGPERQRATPDSAAASLAHPQAHATDLVVAPPEVAAGPLDRPEQDLPASLDSLPEFRAIGDASCFGHDARRASRPGQAAPDASPASPGLTARVRVAGNSVVGSRAIRSSSRHTTLSPGVFNAMTKCLSRLTAVWVRKSGGLEPFGSGRLARSDAASTPLTAAAARRDTLAATAAIGSSSGTNSAGFAASSAASEFREIAAFVPIGEGGTRFLEVLRSYVRNVAIKATRSAAIDCVTALIQAPVDMPAAQVGELVDDAVRAMSDTSAKFARQGFRLLHATSARCGVVFAISRAVVALHPAGSSLQAPGEAPAPLLEDGAFAAVLRWPIVTPEPAATAVGKARSGAITAATDGRARFDATLASVESSALAGGSAACASNGSHGASARLLAGRLVRASQLAPQLQTRVLQWVRGAVARAGLEELPEGLLLVVARAAVAALEDRSAAVRDSAASCLGGCLDLLGDKDTVRALMDGVDLLKASRLALLCPASSSPLSGSAGEPSAGETALFESRAPRDGQVGTGTSATAARLCDEGFTRPPRLPSLRRLCERRLQAMVITGVWDMQGDAAGEPDAAPAAASPGDRPPPPPSPGAVLRQADELIRAAATSGVVLRASKPGSKQAHASADGPAVDDVALGNAVELLAAAPGLQAYRLQVACVLFLKAHSRALVASGLLTDAPPAAKALLAHYRIPPKQSQSSFAQHRSGLRRAATGDLTADTFTEALSASWGVKMAQRKLTAFFLAHRRSILAELYASAPIDGAAPSPSHPRPSTTAAPPASPSGAVPPSPAAPLSASASTPESPSPGQRRGVAAPFDCTRVPMGFLDALLRVCAASMGGEGTSGRRSPRPKVAPADGLGRSAPLAAAGKLAAARTATRDALTPDEQLALLAWWARPLSARRSRAASVDQASLAHLAMALPIAGCSRECLRWARTRSPALFSLLDAATLFDILAGDA